MRVGLRRLRAAISLFSKALSATRVQEIKAELKWLTNALAPAREFDVFVKERIQPIIPRIVPRRGGRAVIKDFSIKRAEAFDHAKKAVASERFRLLLVTLLEWVENRRTYSRFPKVSIEHFAIDILHRRIMKVSKDGRRLQQLPAPARHKIRIRVKKIRYGLEFFQAIFLDKRKAQARLSKLLEDIQGSLGALNDFVAHRKLAADLALSGPPTNRRARAFAAGVVVGREDEEENRLMKMLLRASVALGD